MEYVLYKINNFFDLLNYFGSSQFYVVRISRCFSFECWAQDKTKMALSSSEWLSIAKKHLFFVIILLDSLKTGS